MAIRTLDCCGIKELSTISSFNTPTEAFWLNCVGLSPYQEVPTLPKCRFMIFSQANPSRRRTNDYDDEVPVWEDIPVPTTGYGYNMRDFITTNALGTVHELPTAINPNSTNHLKVWIWELDIEAATKWLTDYAKSINYKPQEHPDKTSAYARMMATITPPPQPSVVYAAGGNGAPAGAAGAFSQAIDAEIQGLAQGVDNSLLNRLYREAVNIRGRRRRP